MMSTQLLITVLVLFVNVANLNASPANDRIVNGTTVNIALRNFQIIVLPVFCGGSLISPYWALTAAHCTTKYKVTDLSFTVGVQKTFVQSSKNTYKVVILEQHKDYNSTTQDNDIALLKSERQVYYDYFVRPVTIANKEVSTGSKVVVSGYGYNEEDGVLSEELMQVELKIVDPEECKHVYGIYLTKNMICAYSPDQMLRDSCQGDSGGPLTYNNALVGIVSFGYGCAQEGIPGVYTKVYNYCDWIKSFTGIVI